jgi:hypothetical protein
VLFLAREAGMVTAKLVLETDVGGFIVQVIACAVTRLLHAGFGHMRNTIPEMVAGVRDGHGVR